MPPVSAAYPQVGLINPFVSEAERAVCVDCKELEPLIPIVLYRNLKESTHRI